nr:structural maintenance of chromosomes protein 4 [Tanacetum cinerariifolium]
MHSNCLIKCLNEKPGGSPHAHAMSVQFSTYYHKKVYVYNEQVEELNVVTNERDETKKQYDGWKKKRLDESPELKEMYQVHVKVEIDVTVTGTRGWVMGKTVTFSEPPKISKRIETTSVQREPKKGFEPTTEPHEVVLITSRPPEFAPVIEENVDCHNDDKESSPLLDAYLKRDEDIHAA